MQSDNPPCAGPGTRGSSAPGPKTGLPARARSVWTSGDFHTIAGSYARGTEEFIARLRLRPGESVLDVPGGSGNLVMVGEYLDVQTRAGQRNPWAVLR
jgi:hypothetical protein